MGYLYHRVPQDIRGSVLYPLNTLKAVYPDIYTRETAKYEGRAFIRNQEIPQLGCFWNDVLHFTAVHPQEIKQAFLDAGVEREFSFYQIRPEALSSTETVVYLNQHQKPNKKMGESNFAPYNPAEISTYSHLSEETKRYYREQIAMGKRPLIYHWVPHILHRGILDVSKASIMRA